VEEFYHAAASGADAAMLKRIEDNGVRTIMVGGSRLPAIS
jgi:hypothetical protein